LNWDDFRGVTYDLQLALDDEFANLVSGFEQLTLFNNAILIEPLIPLTTYHIRIRSTNQNKSSSWVELESITTSGFITFEFKSDDFVSNGKIPTFFSCNGPPPQLNWKNAPEGTVSFAITMIDLDFQNGFNHWIVFNIPVTTTEMPQGSTGKNKPRRSTEGTNDLGARGYFGPCPPGGETHRYYFTLFALDSDLTFGSTIRMDAFLDGIESKTLARTLLIGNYE
jgi:Raf kinase inhibitor-like YbhB/YbcL family protein